MTTNAEKALFNYEVKWYIKMGKTQAEAEALATKKINSVKNYKQPQLYDITTGKKVGGIY